MKWKFTIAKLICSFLPPIVSQTIRNRIITISEGAILNENFRKKSITRSFLYGNTSDFHAFKFSIHGYFDWRNIVLANAVCKYKKGDLVEVGANIGTETISFSDIAKKYNSKVFAYEPLPSNLFYLKLNKRKNNLDNLYIFDCLVSNYSGKALFSLPQGNNSGSGHISNSKNDLNTQVFEVVHLDKVLRKERISFMSIDVEGFEYDVLRGAEQLIKRCRPILVTEVNPKYLKQRGGVSFQKFFEYLTTLNYNCYSIEKLGIREVNPVNFKAKTNKNWICIPRTDSYLVSFLNRSIFLNAFKPRLKIF